MKRGEVWTAAGGVDYAGKPRPVVIVQDDRFDATRSITVALLTTAPEDLPIFRVSVVPTATNGLNEPSRIMADKITSMPRSKMGAWIGHLDSADMQRLDQAMLLFLGLAVTS